ncbi:hypothetical protein LUZ60_004957 [Juncus effusus]|nr:hypothetical protein LUZ60_004957 [Juncus effusus]
MRALITLFLLVLTTSYILFEPCHAVTCGDVTVTLRPCTAYLTGKGTPSGQCCGGVKSLKGKVRTVADRRTACNCMRAEAARVKGMRYDLVNSLPRQCGVNLGFTIDLNRCNA